MYWELIDWAGEVSDSTDFFFRWMSVSSGLEVTVFNDETWHMYSLIFNLDFVESFFDRGENKGEDGESFP